jgi:hypothetical protein
MAVKSFITLAMVFAFYQYMIWQFICWKSAKLIWWIHQQNMFARIQKFVKLELFLASFTSQGDLPTSVSREY